MKKLLLIITLFLSVSTHSQIRETKNSRKKANEMARVLQLSSLEAQRIYEIRLDYLLKVDKLRRANLGATDETFKNLIRPETKTYNNQVFAFLGEDKRKEWKRYLKIKKARYKN